MLTFDLGGNPCTRSSHSGAQRRRSPSLPAMGAGCSLHCKRFATSLTACKAHKWIEPLHIHMPTATRTTQGTRHVATQNMCCTLQRTHCITPVVQAPSCKSEPVVSCPSAAGPVEASLTPAGSQGLTTLDWLLHPQQQEMMQQLQQQGQGPEAADGAAGTAGGGGPGDAPLSSCSPTGPTLSLPPPGDAPAYPLPAAPGLGGALGRSESLAAINAAYESMLGLRAASSLGLAWPDQADGGLDTALAAAPAPVHTRAVALPAAGCPGMEGLGGVRAVSCTQGGSLGGIDDPLGLGLDEAPSCLRALDGLDACCLPPPADDAAAAAAAAAALHPHGALTAASPQQRCTLTPADCAAAAPHPHGSRLHATSGAAAAAGGLDACRPLLLPMLETPTCPAMGAPWLHAGSIHVYLYHP